jgi:nicotinamidase-related amidase
MMNNPIQLPLPSHYSPEKADQVYRVDYAKLAQDAKNWSKLHRINPAEIDRKRILLMLVDIQNTFCIPSYELFVGGCSGRGAVEDNQRLCEFIYHNLASITKIIITMDTHFPIQIFHPIFWVDESGNHPEPYTIITLDDLSTHRWRYNPLITQSLPTISDMQQYVEYYVKTLTYEGKYDLTIWPYHAMLGGIGHAIVPVLEEAIFFHSIVRNTQPDYEIKGDHPLTEHYSALKPEVDHDLKGNKMGEVNSEIMEDLIYFDAMYIAGQAKSHCVAFTIRDLLNEIKKTNKDLVKKVFLLEDCSSPVVIPGVIDYSELADKAYREFEKEGMTIVHSSESIPNLG